jgi:hypothetical protein
VVHQEFQLPEFSRVSVQVVIGCDLQEIDLAPVQKQFGPERLAISYPDTCIFYLFLCRCVHTLIYDPPQPPPPQPPPPQPELQPDELQELASDEQEPPPDEQVLPLGEQALPQAVPHPLLLPPSTVPSSLRDFAKISSWAP